MNRIFALLVIVICFNTITSFALISPQPQEFKNKGFFTGGLGGFGFSILDLRRSASKKENLERIILDVGDLAGNPQLGQPCYFHAEIRNNELILELSQTLEAKISQQKINTAFKNAFYVASSSIVKDKASLSTILNLKLKSGVFAKVYPVEGKKSTAKIVIDLTPASVYENSKRLIIKK